MNDSRSTLEIARTFGRVLPVPGRDGQYCLEGRWNEVSGFFRKLDRLDREFVGPWHCDTDQSWAVIYPWQK